MISGVRRGRLTLLLSILIFASLIWLVSCDNNIYMPDNDTWAVQDMYFASFKDAVSWVSSQDTSRAIIPEERTIRLMRDVSGSENAGSIIVPSTFNGVLQIDFDGHEYCFGTRADSFVEINGGDVVILDEKIVIPGNSQSERNALAVNGASVTINGISIDDRRPAPQALHVGTGGNLVIESSVSGDAEPMVEGGFSLAAGGSLEIRGGVIKVDGLSIEGEASLEINGGVVYYSHSASGLIAQAMEEGGGKAVGVTVHDISDWITEDEHVHYKECSECHEHFEEAAHSFSSWTYDPSLGKTSRTCSVCGRTETIDHNHSLVHHDPVKKTCTTDGSLEYWYCPECGLKFSDPEGLYPVPDSYVLVPASHSLVHVDYSPATCTEDGLMEHYICSDCGRTFKDAYAQEEFDNVVIYSSHQMTHHAPVLPTCTEDGNIEYWECSDCNKVFSDQLGLSETDVKGLVLTKTGHSLIRRDAVAATCTATGTIEYWICSVCGMLFSDADCENEISLADTVVAKIEHSALKTEAEEPTCTSSGNSAYWTCSECGKHFSDAQCTLEIAADSWVVPASGHAVAHVVSVSSTCTSEGRVEYWRCSECGRLFCDEGCTDEIALKDTVVPMLAHTAVRTSAVEPTCTSGGNSGYWTCTECGKHFSDQECISETTLEACVIPALGHEMEHVAAVASTCTSLGNVEYWHCTVCGKDYSDSQGNNEILSTVVPMVAHELEHHDTVAATCTTDGVVEYWGCTECGRLFSDAGGQNEIAEPAVLGRTGHGFGHVAAVAPTCTSIGNVEYWHCTVCGKSYADSQGMSELQSTVTPMVAHDLVHHEAVAATCTSEGSIEYWECSSCGLHFSDGNGSIVVQNISTPVIDHSPLRHAAVSVTCTSDGAVEHWSCSECGGLFSDARCTDAVRISDIVIEAPGHSLVSHPETDSTCVVHGNIPYYECTVCGSRFSDSNGTHEINGSVEKALAEHELSEWVTTDSTSHYKVCSVCGGHFSIEEHSFTGWHYDAEKDLQVNECSVCNRIIEKNHSHVTEFHPAVPHTCTDDGTIAYYQCTECERKYLDPECTIEILNTVDSATHSPVHHDAVSSTCTSEGRVEYCSCSECGRLFSDEGCTDEIALKDTVVPRLAHTAVRTSAVEPTCTSGGNSGYWTCTECGKHFSDQECISETTLEACVIPALGHEMEHVAAVASTCTSLGNVEYWHCTVCGKDYSDSQGNNEILSTVVPMVAHELEHHDTVAATCTTDGVVEYWGCTECGRLFSDAGGQNEIAEPAVLGRTGHGFGHVAAVAPTCTSIGNVEYWHCTVCGKSYADSQGMSELQSTVTPMVAHDLVHHEAVAATCTSEGSIEYWECSSCGKLFSDSQGKTEIEPGLAVIGAFGHSLSHVGRVEATCTSSGVVEHWRCSMCGSLFSDINALHPMDPEFAVISAKGHSAVGTAAVAATCTTAGNSAYWTCSECGRYFSDALCTHEIVEESWVLAAKGHMLVHVDAAAATCTEDGAVEHWHCNVCGKDYADSSACSELVVVTIPASGHSPVVTAAKAATCTEDGNNTYWTCSVCGKHYSDERCIEEIADLSWVIGKLGHSLTENSAVEATCTTAGLLRHWHCSECGHDFSDSAATNDITGSVVVPALGHSIVSTPASSPSCTCTGNSAYWTCSRCGMHFSDALCTHEIATGSWIIPATGHSYSYAYDDTRHWLECEKCGDVEDEGSHVWGEIEVCPDGHHFIRMCTVCGAMRNEDVSKYTEIQTGIGVILVPNAISSPCGSVKTRWVGDVCHVSFVPNINSTDDYGVVCYLLTGGYVRLTADESGDFTFIDSGMGQYRVQVQAYNGGGTNTYELMVPGR